MQTLKQVWFCLMTVVLGAGRALAADASDSAASGRRDELAEIVVTAEKRASTVQETPISMTALTGEALQQQGIVDLQGIIHDVPGISMRTAGPGQTELEMRGLSSSGGSSATVGYYLDDYPLTPPAAALNGKVVLDPDLFDLNRVEVLRGPQGTLYGAGSMGGTVKLVTNAPNLKQFEGEVEGVGSGTTGGGFNYTGNLMLSIPLIADTVALRVVGTDKYVDGWIKRVVEQGDFPVPAGPGPCGAGWPGCTRGDVLAAMPTAVVPRVNWERLQGGRAELLAQPTDALKIDVLAMYQRITMGDYDEYDLPPGIPDEHFQPFNLFEPFHDEFRLYGLTVNYDLSFAQLTSASAYYSRGESQTSDVSEALRSVAGLFGTSLPTFYPIPFNETDSTRQWSEELRLASTGNGPLQWIGGLYFADFESIFAEYNASVPLAFISAGGAAANPLGIIYQAHNPYHVKSYAAFGEGTWAFTDELKLTAGLRYYRYQSRADEETSGFATDSGNAGTTLNSFSQSNSGVNPKATLAYEPSKDLTVYGTVARGFRPGGINQQIPSSICTAYQETYGQDNIWNYELGEKARLFDRRLIVNADFFYIRWDDVQQIINQSCGYPLTVNAGRASSYGPEFEIQALLSEEWTLSFSGTYTHASITSANPAAAVADPAIAPGLAILNVPKYTQTTSLTYTTPISTTFKFTGRIDNSYVGKETDIDFYYGTLPAYNLVNMRLGVSDDRLSAYVFADNLTNKHAQLGINTTGFSWTIPSLVRVVTNQPRTVGVDLRYKF